MARLRAALKHDAELSPADRDAKDRVVAEQDEQVNLGRLVAAVRHTCEVLAGKLTLEDEDRAIRGRLPRRYPTH